ncbi:MAG: RNA-directed DNA polymerase [Bacteroidia bacterium]
MSILSLLFLTDSNQENGNLLSAYRKLKTYAYYDSNLLNLRTKIAEFESKLPEEPGEIDLFFSSLYDKICEYKVDDKNNFILELLEDMEFVFLPKSIASPNENENNFLSNSRTSDKYLIESLTAYYNIPIELHLVCVLWLMKYGWMLDKNLFEKAYGNRLTLNKNKSGLRTGNSLYRPYFAQYQKFRDESVEKAKELIDAGNDVALVNLDIKDFFYSIRLDFVQVEQYIANNDSTAGEKILKDPLHLIFKEIHMEFSSKLRKTSLPGTNRWLSHNKVALPIGVVSSYVLANFYLYDLDEVINNSVKPIYYSRYVDDISLILKVKDVKKYSDSRAFIKKELSHLVKTVNPLQKTYLHLDSNKTYFQLNIEKYEDALFIQDHKTMIYIFDHNESISAIEKLISEIKSKISEFRDLPDGAQRDDEFETEAYEFVFDDSKEKIKTLKDFREDSYGLSVFFGKRIFTILRSDGKANKEETEKIVKFFQGYNSLDFFRLWEKITTYFVVSNDQQNLSKFMIGTLDAISKINLHVSLNVSEEELKNHFVKFLKQCCDHAFALCPTFASKEILSKLNDAYNSLFAKRRRKKNWLSLEDVAIYFLRSSNMIRGMYLNQPLLSFTNYCVKDLNSSLLEKHPNSIYRKGGNSEGNGTNPFSLNEKAKYLSPFKVKFYQCCIAYFKEKTFKIPSNNISEGIWDTSIGFLEESFKVYYSINFPHLDQDQDSNEYKRIKKLIFDYKNPLVVNPEIEDLVFKPVNINQIEINSQVDDSWHSMMIAIANTTVSKEKIFQSAIGNPNIGDRYNLVKDLFTLCRKDSVEFFALPECFLPHDLIETVCRQSSSNSMAVVTGLEHVNSPHLKKSNQNEFKSSALNFIATILPLTIDGEKDCVFLPRLKNHYAHFEKEELEGRRIGVPALQRYEYDIFKFKGVYFTVFYCFELANSFHRSLFKSKIDFMVASEWNPDVNYFSNIIESVTRDIHCYVIQVNTNQYGDSRFTQPMKTDLKDKIRILGGINHTILVEKMNIKALRRSQSKEYRLLNERDFKPTPPEFNKQDPRISDVQDELLGNEE